MTNVVLIGTCRILHPIKTLEEINNAEYINPTELFHQYPQEIVLDKNGEDINHYNKEFIPTVGKYFAERIAMRRD